MLDYYKKAVQVYHVNGEGSVDEVYQRVLEPARDLSHSEVNQLLNSQ